MANSNERIMGFVREIFLSSNPFLKFDDRRLAEFVSSLKPPTHPPYHLMIKRSVEKLNDGIGASEKEISEFIMEEYNQSLPFAHEEILRFHLRKLCDKHELLSMQNDIYILPNDIDQGNQILINAEDHSQRTSMTKMDSGFSKWPADEPKYTISEVIQWDMDPNLTLLQQNQPNKTHKVSESFASLPAFVNGQRRGRGRPRKPNAEKPSGKGSGRGRGSPRKPKETEAVN